MNLCFARGTDSYFPSTFGVAVDAAAPYASMPIPYTPEANELLADGGAGGRAAILTLNGVGEAPAVETAADFAELPVCESVSVTLRSTGGNMRLQRIRIFGCASSAKFQAPAADATSADQASARHDELCIPMSLLCSYFSLSLFLYLPRSLF
jgi:hypothetical protein